MSDAPVEAGRSRICFVWIQFGPYLMDRCEAAAAALPGREVIGVEIAARSARHEYAWASQRDGGSFRKETVFPDDSYDRAGFLGRTWTLVRSVIGLDARHHFLCHYNMPSVFALAVVLRALGRRVFVMGDSKFDDRPRTLWREMVKRLFLMPYNGALVGGRRHREYLQFLGFKCRPIAEGFDTVSMTRLRALAAVPPAPDGVPFAGRRFVVVARLIAKKNLPLVIAAYGLYRRQAGDAARELVILSAGDLAEALQAEVRARNLQGVTFTGHVSDEDMARHLGAALALILPSIEEQWGVAVNEATFMGVPVLCSENVGARDTLVRNGINGFVFGADDVEGLAHLMADVASDEDRWRALAAAALVRAPLGDVDRFGEGVRALIAAAP